MRCGPPELFTVLENLRRLADSEQVVKTEQWELLL